MRVLITGASGLVGQALTGILLERGYEVSVLSRVAQNRPGVSSYLWNPERHEIAPESVNTCDYIIHLAGLNIGGGRWTPKRRKEILDSRVDSVNLIQGAIDMRGAPLKAFISASAIGYYGAVTEEQIFIESDPPGNDFLGETCKKWEAAGDGFSELGIRSAQIRTGVALSAKGGALPRIVQLMNWGLGAALGSGKQYMPWIHMEDLCGIYMMAIENEQLTGAWNAVSPQHLTNKELMKELAQILNKPLWLPNVPAWVMKLLYGEMSAMLVDGSRVSSGKIERAGYDFKYPSIKEALMQIYG